ncbi:MAG: sporulation protein Cse60 [Paludibacteraceae bacterium]
MVQIKLFVKNTYHSSDFENLVNTYLQENETTIEVIDIKYNVHPTGPSDNGWRVYSAMVIYKTKDA